MAQFPLLIIDDTPRKYIAVKTSGWEVVCTVPKSREDCLEVAQMIANALAEKVRDESRGRNREGVRG